MARFNFRQGIARRQEDGVGNPTFLLPTNGGSYIDLIVSPDPTVFLVAHFDVDYLVSEDSSVVKAWGPFTGPGITPGITDFWLYWDVDFTTGELTRGFTILEPVFASTFPGTPTPDQHWFDKSVNVMKVWSGSGWVEKVRVFAAQYVNGATLVHYPLGSQVGLNNINVFAGAILFDPDGNPIQKFQRNRRGQFITTETDMNSQFTRIANFRVEAAVVQGEAQENIPIHHAITYSSFNKLGLARNTVPSKPAIGLSLEEMVTGEVRSYLTKGFITNDIDFDFTGFPAGTPLFVGPTGSLITNPPTSVSIQQIAIVVNVNTIFVDVKQLINLTTTGNIVPIHIDRDTGILYADEIQAGALALNDLKDVSLGSPITDDEVLTYDAATGVWSNQPQSGSGGSPISGGFVNVSLNGGASINPSIRSSLNFIEASGRVDFVINDNPGNNRVDISVDVVETALTITESQISDLQNYAVIGGPHHDTFSDFVASEHVDHTLVTLTAGAGLTGGGSIAASRTFDVGAGNGIIVNANSIEVSLKNSLEFDPAGSPPGTHVQLVNDIPSPGPNQVYGTDGAGIRGWKANPAGGSPSIGQPDQNLWETIDADVGSTTANIPTDTLTIAGGAGISTSIVGDTLTITNDSPNVDIEVQDEGGTITAAVSAINFVGAGVTVTDAGGSPPVTTVTIPGGGGGGGSPSAPVGFFDVFGYEHIEAAPLTTWTIVHGLNTRRVMTQIFETTGSPEGFDQIMPNNIRIVDTNTVEVTFGVAQAGRAYLSLFK